MGPLAMYRVFQKNQYRNIIRTNVAKKFIGLHVCGNLPPNSNITMQYFVARMIVILPIVAYFCLPCNILHCNNSHACLCRHRHMLISRKSEYSYPPRSPNMTPLDSITCGHMTYKCFRNPIPDNIDQLKTNVEFFYTPRSTTFRGDWEL